MKIILTAIFDPALNPTPGEGKIKPGAMDNKKVVAKPGAIAHQEEEPAAYTIIKALAAFQKKKSVKELKKAKKHQKLMNKYDDGYSSVGNNPNEVVRNQMDIETRKK